MPPPSPAFRPPSRTQETALPAPATPAPPGQGAPRIAALDVARGAALVAMGLYHLGWDVNSLQLAALDVTGSPAWQIAARLIAGSFLVLAGASLVLAHGSGVRWYAFLRRLALVGAAALAVTLATAIAVPDGLIFFGVLHCITASSLLALPFLARPAWVALLGAALVFAVAALVRDPLFDAPGLLWSGLGTRTPATNDYVPVFPWFGWVLVGVAASRLGAPLLARVAPWRPRTRLGRGLGWAGRHSLLVYLLHQPVMLAVLVPLALVLGPRTEAGEAAFGRTFVARCEETGTASVTCRAVLACTLGRLAGAEGWQRVLQGDGRPEDDRLVRDATLACYGEHLRGW